MVSRIKLRSKYLALNTKHVHVVDAKGELSYGVPSQLYRRKPLNFQDFPRPLRLSWEACRAAGPLARTPEINLLKSLTVRCAAWHT